MMHQAQGRWRTALFLAAIAISFVPTVRAQHVRQTVLVLRPAQGMPRAAADIVVASRARAAVIESVIQDRMSPEIIHLRRDEARAAFEPTDSLLTTFTVVKTEDYDGDRLRVICDAEVDMGAVMLRLIRSKVLTFGATPPRILLVPAANTDMAAVQALRARLRESLGGAGFDFLAAESITPGFVAKRVATPDGRSSIAAQAAKVHADLVGVISMNTERPSSSVGGVIVDATLQYTIVRPYDRKVVAEQSFTTRGSGATALLANEAVLDELGPAMARSLGGQITSAVFADNDVVDPAAPTAPATVATSATAAKNSPTPRPAPAPSQAGGPLPAETIRPPLQLHRKIR